MDELFKKFEILRKEYDEVIKPSIAAGRYLMAWLELSNHIGMLANEGKLLYLQVKGSMEMMAAARVLQEKLETLAEGGEEQNIGRAVATLDGYMAQTKLPMRPM